MPAVTTSWNLVRGPYPAILGTDWRDGTIAVWDLDHLQLVGRIQEASSGLDEIALVRELAAMSQVQPALGEHRRLFECKDIGIREYTTADRPVAGVDEGPDHAVS